MFTPLATLQAIQQHGASHVLLVPTMIQLTVDHPDAGQYDVSTVQCVLYGGSVISEAVLQRAMKRFSKAAFVQAYGMTELSPCATYLGPKSTAPVRARPPHFRLAGPR